MGSLSESGWASSKEPLDSTLYGEPGFSIGNPTKAEEVYREAIQIDSTALHPHLFLAKLYDQIGKTDEAIKEYEALLLLNHDETIPEIRSAKEALFLLLDRKEIQELTQRGEILTQEGKWGEALQYFQAAAVIDPGLPVVHHNLARFYDKTDRPDLVVQAVNEALLLEPDSRTLHLLLGKALRAKRAFKDSLAAYVKTLSLSPNGQEGLFYLEAQAGLLQTEFEMLKAPIEAASPYRDGLQKKASGEMDEAQISLEQASRLSPGSPLIHQALGEVYEKKGKEKKRSPPLKRPSNSTPASIRLGGRSPGFTLNKDVTQKRSMPSIGFLASLIQA
ncbi:MAG: hypothetical protein MPW14_07800 [Candidatus Manganitrophus sp.]|nr:MAG: hypothetical protein MPW14_07800 [Candidatus Manganitrophus sp.]